MKNILYPKKNTLIVFGVLSMIMLTIYVWNFSFAWQFVFGVKSYIIALLIVLIIGILISIFIDKKHKSKLKFYFVISIIQLLFIWSVSNPIREWQIKNSKKQGTLIIELIDKYKLQNGRYPNSLSEIEQKLNLEIPKRTKIGTKYSYEMYENGNYSLSFRSYYDYDLNYYELNKEWYMTD